MEPIQVAIIGDYNPDFPPHPATNASIRTTAAQLGSAVELEWVPTPSTDSLDRYHAFLASPGSPYQSLTGALDKIEYARTNLVPFLGTCGGFQHAVLEFARNVMGIRDAAHAEYDPYASTLFISQLVCSLAGQTMSIRIAPGTLAARLYQSESAIENYYCNFALNPIYHASLTEAGFATTATDKDNEPRILELAAHPFYLATLFVPQMHPSQPHPILTGWLTAAKQRLLQPSR